MQVGAHYLTAIDILDAILEGVAAEKALLAWARGARYAGSKDRAAVRDIVFDALRRQASYAYRFSLNGRGLALGRATDSCEFNLFNGEGYAPPELSDAERSQIATEPDWPDAATQFDFPQFLSAELTTQYGDALAPLMDGLRDRAPVDLRVNRLKTNRSEAADLLARDLIFTEELADPDALRITQNPRKLNQSRAFSYGFVEIQDLSSQMVARFARAANGETVLDYCAGGGGKTLALGAQIGHEGRIAAWDISPARMKEIPARASRAGLQTDVLGKHPEGSFDLVFVDAPCSGSGAWRRSPDSKWRLTAARLDELTEIQAKIMESAARLVRPGGRLCYATCSILARENQQQARDFLERCPEYSQIDEVELNPLNAGDGFFGALFQRE